MEKLIENGFAFLVRVSIVSIMGTHQVTYWGIACPLWWPGPSWDMETISNRGRFMMTDGVEIELLHDRPVISQKDTLKELERNLLEKAKKRFPSPYKFPNGKDAREIWPALYKDTAEW